MGAMRTMRMLYPFQLVGLDHAKVFDMSGEGAVFHSQTFPGREI